MKQLIKYLVLAIFTGSVLAACGEKTEVGDVAPKAKTSESDRGTAMDPN